MRLLRTCPHTLESQATLHLEEYHGHNIPQYAIVSHTWEVDEVSFADVQNQAYSHRQGYSKVAGALKQAYNDGYAYLWIDTCCIDKSSSAELSEALNSMWTWYQNANICYAVLQDVSSGIEDVKFEVAFASSRWWTRGKHIHSFTAATPKITRHRRWNATGTSSTKNGHFLQQGVDVYWNENRLRKTHLDDLWHRYRVPQWISTD